MSGLGPGTSCIGSESSTLSLRTPRGDVVMARTHYSTPTPLAQYTRHGDIIFGKSKAVAYGKKESVWLTRMVFIHPTIERANDFERDLRQKYGIIAPVEEFVVEAVPTFADVYERNDLVDY
ncbi:hypothetical protein Bbelb_423010 [Branchiostoma belcheri]|nr:hypothetical protein Bbelb_423010 [Branchiostoma belcheri]